MAKKRVTRKQLLKEPDEFLTFSGKALQFADTYRRQILYIALGIVTVLLCFVLFQYMSARSEKKAYVLFQEGLSQYLARGVGASDKLDTAAKEKFANILEQHGSSSAARLTLPIYADLMYQTGDYESAISLYEKALKAFAGDEAFEPILCSGLAYTFEAKKDFAAAAKWFAKVADTEGAPMRADAYFNLGRMYEALDEKEKALEAYQTVANDYAQSVHAKLARDKAERLQG
jgi:tetratricopeptide (TPR) repeat protein